MNCHLLMQAPLLLFIILVVFENENVGNRVIVLNNVLILYLSWGTHILL